MGSAPGLETRHLGHIAWNIHPSEHALWEGQGGKRWPVRLYLCKSPLKLERLREAWCGALRCLQWGCLTSHPTFPLFCPSIAQKDKQMKLTIRQMEGPRCHHGAHFILIRAGVGEGRGVPKGSCQPLLPGSTGGGGAEEKGKLWGLYIPAGNPSPSTPPRLTLEFYCVIKKIGASKSLSQGKLSYTLLGPPSPEGFELVDSTFPYFDKCRTLSFECDDI